MKAYLLVFDDADVDRKTVSQAVDSITDVANWYAFFSNTLCIASECDAKELASKIRSRLPALRFIVSAVEPDQKGGQMPKSVWSFLNDPQPAEKETV